MMNKRINMGILLKLNADMDWVSVNTRIVACTREAGRKIRDMVTALRDFQMVIHTSASIIKAKWMAKAYTSGSTEISTMVNGFKESSTDMGAGKESMVIVI